MKENVVQLKIAYIGGGSRNWAHILMRELALCPELGGEISLYDIDYPAARLNEELGNWLQGQPGVRSFWRYQAIETLEEALTGADLVFISIQPGSLEQMAHEIAVAEQYGRYFPVGDSSGAPGLIRGLRCVPIFTGFARTIAETSPRAWVINYSNPMTICTRILTRVAPELHVFGCCHEVFGVQLMLAELAKKYLDLPEIPARDEISVDVKGINHFTWIDQATFKGNDLLAILNEHIHKPGVMRAYSREEVEAQNNWFFDSRQIKYAMFQRFGLLPAAGDRHLCEFIPGFNHSPEELFRWGVIRTPVSYRIKVRDGSSQLIKEYLAAERRFILTSSGEEVIRQIKALIGLGDFVTNLNFENVGQQPDLLAHAVVESNVCISRDVIHPLATNQLSTGICTMVARHIANQETIIEAGLTGDKDLAFQAIFNDPTTDMPIDTAWEMFNRLLG